MALLEHDALSLPHEQATCCSHYITILKTTLKTIQNFLTNKIRTGLRKHTYWAEYIMIYFRKELTAWLYLSEEFLLETCMLGLYIQNFHQRTNLLNVTPFLWPQPQIWSHCFVFIVGYISCARLSCDNKESHCDEAEHHLLPHREFIEYREHIELPFLYNTGISCHQLGLPAYIISIFFGQWGQVTSRVDTNKLKKREEGSWKSILWAAHNVD